MYALVVGGSLNQKGKGCVKEEPVEKVGCQWLIVTMEDMHTGVAEIAKSNTTMQYLGKHFSKLPNGFSAKCKPNSNEFREFLTPL